MKVLITAGTVYGRLDDNKLVGNRIRGIWATKYAVQLSEQGHDVTLLLPDTFDLKTVQRPVPGGLLGVAQMIMPESFGDPPKSTAGPLTILQHNGYDSYAAQCYELAPQVDAAIMAAAVVNWIPAEPIKGKMKTEGFAEGAIIHIPFVLAPRVIDRMRKLNPKLKLIGCKMTSGAEREATMVAAYQTLLKAHCNVVIANDLSRLKEKTLVYPDGRKSVPADFEAMYAELTTLLSDEFYRTERDDETPNASVQNIDYACTLFDQLCERYRERFSKRPEGPHGPNRVFGSLAVRIDSDHVLVSPREKGTMFDSKDAVVVTRVDPKTRTVFTVRGRKATLNAPLLFRVLTTYRASTVMHLHEEKPEWPTLPYGPPGSVRDNDRPFTTSDFNIDGHGCVFIP